MAQRTLKLPGATALVVGNMVGVGILLTPRLVAQATPGIGPLLGLWLLGGLVALAGAAVYAELGSRFPEAGGDVVFQEQGFGRAVALGSGVLMFLAAFSASIAAIAVAIGTWQVPNLLGLPTPAEGLLPQGVGIGVIALLTLANLAGLRVGALVQIFTTALPVLGLAGLALWTLASGTGVPQAIQPGGRSWGETSALVTAFSGVYFAYAGWPAVVYLAGEVERPSWTLPRAMLGGTLLVTGLYLLLNLAFVQALGLDGLGQTFEAGSALVEVLLGEGAGWMMAVVVLLALLASVNATIAGGARVALALARRGGLPRVFGEETAAGVPRNALLLQAALSALIVLSGTFDQIVEGSVLAMMAIGSLTVLSLVVLRLREPGGEPGEEPGGDGTTGSPGRYRASLWPLPAAVYLLVSGGVLGLGLWSALTTGGLEGRMPVASLVLLAVLVAGFRARLGGRPRR